MDYRTVVDQSLKIFEQYNMAMTLRQLYYRLVAKLVFPNNLNSYKRLSKIMVKAREDGEVPDRFIEDRSQLCRLLNGKPLSYCYDCRDYGNMWKRKRGILKEPDCRIRKGSVWYRLQQLLEVGLIWAQREKRKDRFMSRGWDYMRIYYLIGGVYDG